MKYVFANNLIDQNFCHKYHIWILFSHSIHVCLIVYFFMSFFLWHRIVFLFYLLQGEEGSGKYFPLSSSLERRDLYKCQHSSSLISSIKKRNLVIFEGASLAQPGFEPFDFKFLKGVTILDRLVEQTPIEWKNVSPHLTPEGNCILVRTKLVLGELFPFLDLQDCLASLRLADNCPVDLRKWKVVPWKV